MEATYLDQLGVEYCSSCDQELGYCACTCDACDEPLAECSCDDD